MQTVAKYIVPRFKKKAYNCPHCRVVALHKWVMVRDCEMVSENDGYDEYPVFEDIMHKNKKIHTSSCANCNGKSIWVGADMVYPSPYSGLEPHEDLPEASKRYFIEASAVFQASPAAAAAMLRRSLEEFCKEFNITESNLAQSITKLVDDSDLSQRGKDNVKKIMHAVRLIGNEAVHAGDIDLGEKREFVATMFDLVNNITDKLITTPKKENEVMNKIKGF